MADKLDDQYLQEFNISNVKFITSMEELSRELKSNEINLLHHHIAEAVGEIDDFFNQDDEYGNYYDHEIRIIRWIWKYKEAENVLIDINGWPGDNEDGIVILDGKVVFTNRDQDITSTDECPLLLKERVNEFAHLRIFACEDISSENETNLHPHCLKIESQYQSLTKK